VSTPAESRQNRPVALTGPTNGKQVCVRAGEIMLACTALIQLRQILAMQSKISCRLISWNLASFVRGML
jgi:hypothetical protein